MPCPKYAYRKLRLDRLQSRANEKLSMLERADKKLEEKWQLRLDLVTIRVEVSQKMIRRAKDDKQRWLAEIRLKRAEKRYSFLVAQFERIRIGRMRAALPPLLY